MIKISYVDMSRIFEENYDKSKDTRRAKCRQDHFLDLFYDEGLIRIESDLSQNNFLYFRNSDDEDEFKMRYMI